MKKVEIKRRKIIFFLTRQFYQKKLKFNEE